MESHSESHKSQATSKAANCASSEESVTVSSLEMKAMLEVLDMTSLQHFFENEHEEIERNFELVHKSHFLRGLTLSFFLHEKSQGKLFCRIADLCRWYSPYRQTRQT